MKLIIKYCKPYMWRMLYGFLIKIAGTFADLGLPWVLSYILDNVVPLGEIRPVLYWGAFMLFLAVAARYCNIWANRKASLVARDVTRAVRHDLFVKTMGLSGSQTDSLHIPSLVSRMTSDTYNIHHMVGKRRIVRHHAKRIIINKKPLRHLLDDNCPILIRNHPMKRRRLVSRVIVNVNNSQIRKKRLSLLDIAAVM